MALYALDTNVYIAAIRSDSSATDLKRFYSAHAPRCFMLSPVLHELLVGAKTREKRRELHSDIGGPFVRTGRILTPSHQAWCASGETLARIAEEEQVDRASFPRSFIADAIIAACCRENGVTLVTANTADFSRIARALKFNFVAPYPA
jgi:predicted nucleic acid-binding protein